ncbi:tRNA guanosine(34) transglycosylase Tgt [Urbifossiella limnaea]|uniref:Queuine tRNA-ribosyltransferase n=1 Tax=Urbifossiella limnaea TaxID=2528023 RepID=A0A517XU86_9BACT|nr:tRNA guanosine(34) transglycosylase Tgt [Urbifossiella limnaea]QDU21069.1 Queuine tRNA-ribosyltransferase [Urbifossiella limnaea]
MALTFTVQHRDGAARAGVLTLPHGRVETPVFMPVGTQATVKGLTPDMVRRAGVQIILGNTYHLALRPGDTLVAELGGLHRFMAWDRPILTDSGGFQVFSLATQVKITDRGATFRSHIDGSPLELTPERAVEIQQNLGSDIAMVLDQCPPGAAPDDVIRTAVRRSILWAERCKTHHTRADQSQFAIVQGGTNLALREECARELVAMDFPGYALGGFSVGEGPEAMHAALPACAVLLPDAKPRYLMGVGRPEDLLAGVAAGIDMFDCVMPTRNGRNALAFTDDGPIRLRNAKHRRDTAPVESGCPCDCCTTFSRAYLHHLFAADEMLGPTLLSLHNVSYYLRLMASAREAIRGGRFEAFRAGRLARWEGRSID